MPLDLKERDRRFKLIRERMAAEKLDALIVISNAQYEQKGFARYLTNYNNPIYGVLVIFPREGKPKLLAPSPLQEYWTKRLAWIEDIQLSRAFGQDLVANLRALDLSRGRLGLINSKIMPADVYVALTVGCPEAEIVDATPLLEAARAVKSDAELELVRISARLAELSFETVAKTFYKGITEQALIAEVDRALIANGAENIFHLFSSDPTSIYPYLPSNRRIEEKDIILMNTELSGPDGYWVQMVRTYFIGKPEEKVKRMYDTLLKIRTQSLKELQPNRKASEIAGVLRQIILDAGYHFGVHFGHALGLDVVERPLVSLQDDMVLAPGMVITVHPHLVSSADRVGVWLGDTYLITSQGAELLTPHWLDLAE